MPIKKENLEYFVCLFFGVLFCCFFCFCFTEWMAGNKGISINVFQNLCPTAGREKWIDALRNTEGVF